MTCGKCDKNSLLMERLVKSIHDRSLRLSVLGSGYVGLLTAALFGDAGFSVEAVDVRREVVDAVNSGVSPVSEPGLQELVERNVLAGRLKSSLNSQVDLSNLFSTSMNKYRYDNLNAFIGSFFSSIKNLFSR